MESRKSAPVGQEHPWINSASPLMIPRTDCVESSNEECSSDAEGFADKCLVDPEEVDSVSSVNTYLNHSNNVDESSSVCALTHANTTLPHSENIEATAKDSGAEISQPLSLKTEQNFEEILAREVSRSVISGENQLSFAVHTPASDSSDIRASRKRKKRDFVPQNVCTNSRVESNYTPQSLQEQSTNAYSNGGTVPSRFQIPTSSYIDYNVSFLKENRSTSNLQNQMFQQRRPVCPIRYSLYRRHVQLEKAAAAFSLLNSFQSLNLTNVNFIPATNERVAVNSSLPVQTLPHPRSAGYPPWDVPNPPGIGLYLDSIANVQMNSHLGINGHTPIATVPSSAVGEGHGSGIIPMKSSAPFEFHHPIEPLVVPAEREAALDETRRLYSDQFIGLEEIHNHRQKRQKKKKSSGDGSGHCNCAKTNCTKLYCDCFAAGNYCQKSCACQGCQNNPPYEELVTMKRSQIESRNPLAFAPKIIEVGLNNTEGESSSSSSRHKKGCNCKKSKCLKNYCECYQANVGCSIECRCDGCENAHGRRKFSLGEMIIGSAEAERQNTTAFGKDISHPEFHGQQEFKSLEDSPKLEFTVGLSLAPRGNEMLPAKKENAHYFKWRSVPGRPLSKSGATTKHNQQPISGNRCQDNGKDDTEIVNNTALPPQPMEGNDASGTDNSERHSTETSADSSKSGQFFPFPFLGN